MRRLNLLTLFALCFGMQLSANELSSIYRIQASECDSGRQVRFLTGFVPLGDSRIITALHGVVGCKNIIAVQASSPAAVVKNLKISHASIASDVAALSSSEAIPTGELQLFDDVNSTATYRVVGFPQGVTGVHTMPVSVLSPPTISLRKRIPHNLLRQFADRASPILDLDVIDVLGDLQIGHSGAPLIDANDKVVGIVNGGLGSGEFGIGWAMPIRGLQLSAVNQSAIQSFSAFTTRDQTSLFASSATVATVTGPRIDKEMAAALVGAGTLLYLRDVELGCVASFSNELEDADVRIQDDASVNEIIVAMGDRLTDDTYSLLLEALELDSGKRERLNYILSNLATADERELVRFGYTNMRYILLLRLEADIMYRHNDIVDLLGDVFQTLNLSVCVDEEQKVSFAMLLSNIRRLQLPSLSDKIPPPTTDGMESFGDRAQFDSRLASIKEWSVHLKESVKRKYQ